MPRLDHMPSLARLVLRAPVGVLAILVSTCAFGQISMSLSSGSGAPGTGVVLNLSMSDPNNTQPASLQWVMTYSTVDFSGVVVAAGASATAASKTLSCNTAAGTSTCILYGMNETPIASGVVATVTLTISGSTPDTSSNLQLTSGMASTGTGGLITSTNSGSTVTIVQPTVALTGVSCSPASVIGGQPSTCTVTLSSNAVSGTFTVAIANGNTSLVAVPTSVSVALNANSATFTAVTTGTATTTPVTITASAGGVVKTTTLTVMIPCTYTLTPQSRLFTAGGGSTTVTVTTGTGCAWTATTNYPAWITLQSGGVSGNGSGSFVYSVVANTTSARLATITVGNASFKVMEDGSTSLVPFNDVLPSDPYFNYVSLMSSYAITVGCQASPPLYCPTTPVTRAEMAVFVVRGIDLGTGATLTYPTTAYFGDLPATGVPDSEYFDYVQRIAQLGITVGCQASPPLYCPDESITQGEMAVYMIRAWMFTTTGSATGSFTYPTTPYFTDVPATDEYFSYIQKMAQLGFWTGCTATTYCENSAVTRDQMAPMIMRSMLGAP
jgi:hypothetical protein